MTKSFYMALPCSLCSNALMPRLLGPPSRTQSPDSKLRGAYDQEKPLPGLPGSESHDMIPWLHFLQTSYFDIISRLEKSCKISPKNS